MALVWGLLLVFVPTPRAVKVGEDNCDSTAAECSTTITTSRWFCSHKLSWEECKEHLPSERVALRSFLQALRDGNEPQPTSFHGQGIVMSGGPAQLLQALANLHILRHVLKSELPVEFWHAFELHESHCERLAFYGARCRDLRSPGVYPHWQTMTPAILSSSFREVLWMDTDVTPLVRPERLFDTETFRKEGALFWPDHWGRECSLWGETSWEFHVAWHLLDLDYNSSQPLCIQELECGVLLVDKQRHWKPLCLSHYLATRHFFTRVLWGSKDVFRFAWLKLRASCWYSPIRPGLVGWYISKKFQAMSLVQFWPAGGEFGFGTAARPVPLYIHQKKMPFTAWQEIVTFRRELGQCINYQLVPFAPDDAGRSAERWRLQKTDLELASLISDIDHTWSHVYQQLRGQFEKDYRETPGDVARLHPSRDPKRNVEFHAQAKACDCDYVNNTWFRLITHALDPGAVKQPLPCNMAREPTAELARECPIGLLLAGLLCFRRLRAQGDARGAEASRQAAAALLPGLVDCLPFSFWPLPELPLLRQWLAIDEEAEGKGQMKAQHGQQPQWKLQVPQERLAQFPALYSRCVPLENPDCWPVAPSLSPHLSCIVCCDPKLDGPLAEACFDGLYTPDVCCRPLPGQRAA